ncbi:acetate--CoA ligase family protein [Mesorhizobium sp. M1006]|uniref:acetate--CoA ligase family protein n=1 Tax=Mesorhizobium sp. M1006 TaxID=2957048 RepID=UPI00333DD6F0
MNEERRLNLRRLLKPRSVALIGGRALAPSVEMLRRAGFEGRIDIVNPSHAEIAGIACVPTIDDLPEAPDAAFLNVNRHLTIEAVAALARRDTGGAVCFAAGFGEMGESGKSLQGRLVAAAGDLAIVGPNSNGLLNRLDRLALWPMNDHVPYAVESGAAFISQSGGIAYAFVRDRRQVRAAVVASTGNQALLDVADWLAVLGEDPRITTIGIFLEGPGDVAALSEAAKVTRARGVPVVVLKSGRSALGAEMALTHTGSMAGDDHLFDALCDRLGFTRVHTLPQLQETLKAMNVWRGRLPGNRMTVLTASGASRALFADAAADAGLALPAPSAAIAASLRKQLPEFAHVSNPLDHNAAYTGMVGLSLENEPALYECFRTMLADGYDIGVMNSDSGDGLESPSLKAWVRAARDTGIASALVTTMPDYISENAHRICRENGIAALHGVDDGVAAIAAVVRHSQRVAAAADGDIGLPEAVAADGGSRIIDEWGSKAAMEVAGVPFPDRRMVARGEVASAAAAIGFPVVLKAVSPLLLHKNRIGAVALGLADEAALTGALDRMEQALCAAGIKPDGFLVEKMVSGAAAEIIVGVKASRIYGHALVIGAGGVNVEHLKDSAVLLLPATRAMIEASIAGLRTAAGLSEQARKRLADIAEAVAAYAVANRHTLVSLDINPVIVTREGDAVAVDALIETRGRA